ncbi:hypothetical protein GWI33_000379, partial [Rhynchophorus ferrugineus]
VTEALCKEQQDKIQALCDERDDLKKKLEACMKELDNFKRFLCCLARNSGSNKSKFSLCYCNPFCDCE